MVSSHSSVHKHIEFEGFTTLLTSSLKWSMRFNDAKIFQKCNKLFPPRSLVYKPRVSKCIFPGSGKNRKPVSRGRKNIACVASDSVQGAKNSTVLFLALAQFPRRQNTENPVPRLFLGLSLLPNPTETLATQARKNIDSRLTKN